MSSMQRGDDDSAMNSVVHLPRLITAAATKRPGQPAGLSLATNASGVGAVIASISTQSPFCRNNVNVLRSQRKRISSDSIVSSGPVMAVDGDEDVVVDVDCVDDDDDDGTAETENLEPHDEILLINSHRVRNPKLAAMMIKSASSGKLKILASRGRRMEGMSYCLAKIDDDYLPREKGEEVGSTLLRVETSSSVGWHGLQFLPSQDGKLIRIMGMSQHHDNPFVKIGLEIGDVILSVDGEVVHSVDDAQRLLGENAHVTTLVPFMAVSRRHSELISHSSTVVAPRTRGMYMRKNSNNTVSNRVVVLLVYSLWSLRRKVLSDALSLGGNNWKVSYSHEEKSSPLAYELEEEEEDDDRKEHIVLRLSNSTAMFRLDFDSDGMCSCHEPYKSHISFQTEERRGREEDESRDVNSIISCDARAGLELLYRHCIIPAINSLNDNTSRQLRLLADAVAASDINAGMIVKSQDGGGRALQERPSKPTTTAECDTLPTSATDIAIVGIPRADDPLPSSNWPSNSFMRKRMQTYQPQQPPLSNVGLDKQSTTPVDSLIAQSSRCGVSNTKSSQFDRSSRVSSMEASNSNNQLSKSGMANTKTRQLDRLSRRSVLTPVSFRPETLHQIFVETNFDSALRRNSSKIDQSLRTCSTDAGTSQIDRSFMSGTSDNETSQIDHSKRRITSSTETSSIDRSSNEGLVVRWRSTGVSSRPREITNSTSLQRRTVQNDLIFDESPELNPNRVINESLNDAPSRHLGAHPKPTGNFPYMSPIDRPRQIDHLLAEIIVPQFPYIDDDISAITGLDVSMSWGRPNGQNFSKVQCKPSIVPNESCLEPWKQPRSSFSECDDDTSSSSISARSSDVDSSDSESSDDNEDEESQPQGGKGGERSQRSTRRHRPSPSNSSTTEMVVYNAKIGQAGRNVPPELAVIKQHPLTKRLKMRITDIRKSYKVSHRICGTGSFGTVRSCTHRSTRQKYAVKSIAKAGNENIITLLKNELVLVQRLKHRHVVMVVDVIQDLDYIHIVMEECLGGDLFHKISSGGIRLPENRACEIVVSLLDAVAYLHNRDIVHRDLKPEHIMLSKDDIMHSDIKVIDFGLAIIHGPNDPPMTALAGSTFTFAPEVLKRSYGRECDLWSVGVITYFLLTSQVPFNAKTNKEVFDKIVNGWYHFPRWAETGLTEMAKDFVGRLLVVDPRQRMTAKKALSHPWIRGALIDEL